MQGQAVVPVQGQAVVPVQGQAVVPVQGQAVVPVTGQAAAAQGVAGAQVLMPATAQGVQCLNPQDVEEFCRRVQALKAAMQAHSSATQGVLKKECP